MFLLQHFLFKQNHKKLKELYLEAQTAYFGKHPELDTRPYEHFYHNARYYKIFPSIKFSS
jgi:hypothetical protein